MSNPPASSEVVSIADADLVIRARGGDRAAEDLLYRRHAPAVARTVVRLAGSKQDAEDIVHDAFVSAFSQLGRLREPAAFKGWLTQIAITYVRRSIRRTRLRRALGLLPATDDACLERLASRDLSPERRADLAVIDSILARTAADDRIAWSLRMIEGQKLEEVAELTGCSLATAKRRIARVQARVDATVRMTGEGS
ncbi:MAG: RNA polymerase sigma factor [Sandaracinaceae bacterium]